MIQRQIDIEPATPQAIAPFGKFVGVAPEQPLFAQWPGAKVHGPTPIDIGDGGELLHVTLESAHFPVRVSLLERHFRHSQTYLPANGKPFVMVLGDRTQDGLPDPSALRAFLFADTAGVVLDPGVWHEFPAALHDDTRFTVVLRAESHVNDLTAPAHPLDARGPDLERYDMEARAEIWLRFRSEVGS
jgi:ureidoglycolate lyase